MKKIWLAFCQFFTVAGVVWLVLTSVGFPITENTYGTTGGFCDCAGLSTTSNTMQDCIGKVCVQDRQQGTRCVAQNDRSAITVGAT